MESQCFETVALDDKRNAVVILDQTLLPQETKFISLSNAEEVWEAIRALRVRGAPAIGIAAAMGLYAHMAKISDVDFFENEFYKTKSYLSSSRPTAVNLDWALERMTKTFEEHRGNDIPEILTALRETARTIKDEDTSVCRSIGEYGASLIKPGFGILTHCNAGALATSRYGTALAPLYVLHERGIPFRVFADETRPLLQGARLTAYELFSAGIDVTLICDNMAAHVMQRGWVDAVFVGCDRVAANGDAANKIGTCGVAMLAAAHKIPFYVCAPFSTIDPATADGSQIIIEERHPSEVTEMWFARPSAPAGVKVYNPAFDVTPAEYVTAFVTERGVIYPPYDFSV